MALLIACVGESLASLLLIRPKMNHPAIKYLQSREWIRWLSLFILVYFGRADYDFVVSLQTTLIVFSVYTLLDYLSPNDFRLPNRDYHLIP
jgi:hypothetical protein